MLRDSLEQDDCRRYQLSRVPDITTLRGQELDESYHAVLLDMRRSHAEQKAAIEFIGDLSSTLVLVCLCERHNQLRQHRNVIHLVDDYLILNAIDTGELPTRISHAIRRRYKEHSLIMEQQLLKSLLDNIPDAIYFKDLSSRFLKVNANMLERYCDNCTLEQIIGKSDVDLFTNELSDAAYADEQRIISSGEPMISKIEKLTRPDGRINWVNTTKIPMRDERDRIIGTMGISRDITELKQAEDDLIRERSVLKTVIDHAPAGIFVKDLEGRYLVVNEKHAQYLNSNSPQTVIGKTLFDFFPHNEAARIDALDRKIMQTEKGMIHMIDHRKLPGRDELYLLTSKVPYRDENGKVTGLVGISQDITQQKLNERKLHDTCLLYTSPSPRDS